MCCSKCCSVTQQKIWVFGSGILFLALGLLFSIGGPPLVRNLTLDQFVLRPGTKAFEKWVKTPIPIYLNMYLFNWTNADRVHEPGVKPNFDQRGPYVFAQDATKEDVTFNANATVGFKIKRVWRFMPEMSNGTLDDNITCPHFPSIAAATIVRDYNRIAKLLFNTQLNGNGGSLYKTYTANQWLFEGFADEFLMFANRLNLPINLDRYKERFGWFVNRNGSETYEGDYEIDTGARDISHLGEIQHWKGRNNTGYYEGECGSLNGSTSDIFPPNLNPTDPITIFVVDTTRIINLYPTDKKVNIQGIEGVRYETTPDTFDNGQRNKDMECYCPKNLRPDNCPPSGATYLGGFLSKAPMYLSHPNFLYADPHYSEGITGLRPDFDKDIFTITLEPTLSIPLNVQANVQANVRIQRDDQITITKNIPESFYAPMFIVCNKATLPEDLARQVKLTKNLPAIVRYIGYGFIAFAVILIIIGGILTVTRNWYGQKRQE